MSAILIVDDNVDILELLSDLLSVKGYTVSTARSAESALLKIREDRPDLILLDVDLPRMSGVDLCRQLRSREDTRDLPIIIISGTFGEQTRLEAKAAGCDAYINKPPDFNELNTEIRTLLGVEGDV